jgi:hypothetical protein
MWKDISTAPRVREVELAVIDDHVQELRYPCFHTGKGWVNAETLQELAVKPTHWQEAPITAFLCCCG